MKHEETRTTMERLDDYDQMADRLERQLREARWSATGVDDLH